MTRRKPDWADEAARGIVTACEFSVSVKPLTWVDDLHENVAAALRAERERCAGIAEALAYDLVRCPEHLGWNRCTREIEDRIRAGDQP